MKKVGEHIEKNKQYCLLPVSKIQVLVKVGEHYQETQKSRQAECVCITVGSGAKPIEFYIEIE